MYRGFPLSMIRLLRCQQDNAQLDLVASSGDSAQHVRDGALQCRQCGRVFVIEQGVVQMLEPAMLSAESQSEVAQRDGVALRDDGEWELSDWSRMEVQPTIEASQPLDHSLVLELGAGTGRCTVEMAAQGATVLATDFSNASLRVLATRAKPEWSIGLVCTDCTRLSVQPRVFHLVASTLMSNLPTAEDRTRIMRLAARACAPSGKFVFGTHYYSIRSVIRRELKAGYYREIPIYRYLFRADEIKRETLQFFGHVECHPTVICLPLLSRLGAPTVKISRLSEHVPILNRLGRLLLVIAREPVVAEQFAVR